MVAVALGFRALRLCFRWKERSSCGVPNCQTRQTSTLASWLNLHVVVIVAAVMNGAVKGVSKKAVGDVEDWEVQFGLSCKGCGTPQFPRHVRVRPHSTALFFSRLLISRPRAEHVLLDKIVNISSVITIFYISLCHSSTDWGGKNIVRRTHLKGIRRPPKD